MITLYGFGPMFGLPDPSPFVIKTMTQLKMAGLPFAFERARPPEAPKGKIPFIRDGDFLLGDSVFILDHLRRAHGVELDGHLTQAQRSVGWAMERMLEDHLYWRSSTRAGRSTRISTRARRSSSVKRRRRRSGSSRRG